MNRLSLIQQDHEFLMRQIPGIIPGIEKMVCIYYEKVNDRIKAAIVNNPDDLQEFGEADLNIPPEIIAQLRIVKVPYVWLSPDDIPFEITKEASKVKDIFSETDNTVLLLRLTNKFDKYSDLFYLYFRNNKGNFTISLSDKPLTTENKALLGIMIYNTLHHFIKQKRKDESLYRNFISTNQSLVREISYYKSELSKLKDNYGQSLINLANSYLDQFGKQYDVKFAFSDTAKEKLIHFNGNIKYIEIIIRNSVEYALSVINFSRGDEILIKDWYINIEEFGNQNNREVIADAENREEKILEKTLGLLNRLEEAARKVDRDKRKPTSSNVGKAFSEPVTAPAITDSLKKHKNKIRILFEKYPQRWDFIRSRFKPVLNLIDSFNENMQETA